jgi:Fe-S cluster assembly iron-binding protein IscA
MLRLTNDASAAVADMRTERGLSEEYGLRLYTATSDDGQRAIRLEFVETPRKGDEVADADNARVFVARELADALDGRVLDVTQDDADPRLVLQPA